MALTKIYANAKSYLFAKSLSYILFASMAEWLACLFVTCNLTCRYIHHGLICRLQKHRTLLLVYYEFFSLSTFSALLSKFSIFYHLPNLCGSRVTER